MMLELRILCNENQIKSPLLPSISIISLILLNCLVTVIDDGLFSIFCALCIFTLHRLCLFIEVVTYMLQMNLLYLPLYL